MIVNYWILPIALILLWFPRQWLRAGRKVLPSMQQRPAVRERDASDTSLKMRREMSNPRNWIDLLRAGVGGIAIGKGSFELEATADKTDQLHILLLQVTLLFIAILIQTMRFDGKLKLVAPAFFALGLGFSLIGWQAALFAGVLVITLNLLLPSVGLFLFVFGGLQLGFGILLGGGFKEAAATWFITATPVFFSLLSNRPLMQQLGKKARPMPART